MTRSSPAAGERVRGAGQAERVGGHRDLEVAARAARCAATMSTRPRRTSGSPPVNRTSWMPEQAHADVDQPDDLVVGQHGVVGQPVEALGRHAVGAAQVAAVGQRDPQVGRDPAEAVAEAQRRGSRDQSRDRRSPPARSAGWRRRLASPGAVLAVPGQPALVALRSSWCCWPTPPGGSAVAVPPARRPQARATRSSSGNEAAPAADPSPTCWRPVARSPTTTSGGRCTATGHLRRRRDRGRPLPHPRRRSGVDVVVPLVTADGTALLVDRGWLATDNRGSARATSPTRRRAR